MDGRSHLSPWGHMFSDSESDFLEGNCQSLNKDEFFKRIKKMSARSTMYWIMFLLIFLSFFK